MTRNSREHAETLLWEKCNWHEMLMDNLHIYAVFAMDLERTILTWNPGVKAVLGYERDEFIGMNSNLIFTEEDRAAGVPEHEARTAERQGNANDVRWHLRKDGGHFWASGALVALKDETGTIFGFGKVMRDSTAEKQADDALRESEAALKHLNDTLEVEVEERTREVRELATQLTLAEVQERSRLAQVLHDDLQQQLFTVQFALRELGAEVSETGRDSLTRVNDLLKEAVRAARQVTSDLSAPGVLMGELNAGLRVLGEQMRERYGLNVTVNDTTIVQGDAIRVLLYSLARELLFNVVKHAGTDQASVSLREHEGKFELTVEDRGVGFNPVTLEGEPHGTGLGLTGIRKRLRLLGGSMEINSSEEGSRVTITLPTTILTQA